MKTAGKKKSNSASPPHGAQDSRVQIEIRAYWLWQASGCCDGRDVEHWLQAESELAAVKKEGLEGEKREAGYENSLRGYAPDSSGRRTQSRTAGPEGRSAIRL